MKKIFTLVFAFSCSLVAVAQSTSTYSGNGGAGFGGTIGNSTLGITENTTTLTFTLTKGAGNFNDALVIYLDVTPNGENSTSSYVDNSDPSRTAISGFSSFNNRSVLNFPSGFGADFAISVSPTDNYAGLWTLNNTGNFTPVQGAGLSPQTNNSATYTFSILKSNIGFSNTTAAFTFVGTYLNKGTSTYRSNEGYGTSSFSLTNADGNPGYNTTTAVLALVYPLQTLPVKLLSFTGNIVDTKGKLAWQVANDDEVSQYEIEKSTDGKKYATLQTVAARRTSAIQSYTIEDATLSGTNLYRLKTTDLQGITTYSKIVQLSVGVKGQGFTIFPNPVQQTLNIKMAKLEKGRYDVNVYNAAGQMVFAKIVQYDGAGNTIQVELPGNLQRGNYNCIMSSSNGKFTSSFLKQ